MIDGVIIDLPAIIKAIPDPGNAGKRMVEVEASVELEDSEGDLILQKALLDAAPSFVSTGHLDIDHLSELGARMGIPNPESFIIGRPTEVKDIGEKRTSVVGEIMRSTDGTHDPMNNKYDAFWDSLQADPPVVWRASVYGFPHSNAVVDCSGNTCGTDGPSRYLIKAMDWRSLAFTRSPVNDKIVHPARIITAKSFIAMKNGAAPYTPVNAMPTSPMAASMNAPRDLTDAVGHYHNHMKKSCPHTAGANTTYGFHKHFVACCGMPEDMADLYAHALMYHVLRSSRRR